MKNAWGGDWTEQKLMVFEKYVKAYLKIMHSSKRKRNWPKEVIYFDGFAGCGIRKAPNSNLQQTLLNDLNITTEEENLYQGSAERVLKLSERFDRYIFVDINENNISELKKRLLKKKLDLSNCHFHVGDTNEKIAEALYKDWNNERVSLVLLDPFGLQINWNTIQAMKEKRIDLWILLPTGLVINRLLDKNAKIRHADLLSEKLGLCRDEIEKNFYVKNRQLNLFNENSEFFWKDPKTIGKIASMYIEQLKNIFRHVTPKPLELKNSKNVTIFHFIFASNNEAAVNIAQNIIENTAR